MFKFWALIFVGVGLIVLFAGDQIAGVGQSVDNLIANKWTGAGLLLLGVVLFIGGDSSVKLKVERAI
jgi:hypothetical protein